MANRGRAQSGGVWGGLSLLIHLDPQHPVHVNTYSTVQPPNKRDREETCSPGSSLSHSNYSLKNKEKNQGEERMEREDKKQVEMENMGKLQDLMLMLPHLVVKGHNHIYCFNNGGGSINPRSIQIWLVNQVPSIKTTFVTWIKSVPLQGTFIVL